MQRNQKKKRLQLNIRLTPEQNELINKRLQQTQIPKTQFIIDSINNNPIYVLPNLEKIIQIMKNLGNQTQELSKKIDNNDTQTQQLIEDIQKGCNEFWQLLKSLKQEKPKQV